MGAFEKQILDILEWGVREIAAHGARHLFWVVCIVIASLYFGRGYRRRMKALETGAENMLRENKESYRRIDNLERLLVASRAQTIVVQLPDGSQKDSELGKTFSGEAIVNKRRPTLEEDFKTAPGSGKVAARLILQADDASEAERILNIFEPQPERIDEAYPYAAFATKLAEQDEMTQAHDALRRLPESAQWQVDEAIEWALSELGEDP